MAARPTDTDDRAMICPACSFENIQGSDQCENCGADLRTSDIPQPGNVLEARLVGDHLSQLDAEPPLSVGVGDSVRDVLGKMQQARIGSVLVRDGDRVAGIFTERDALLKLAGRPLDGISIADVMTPDPVVLREEDSVAVAIHKMAVGGFRHIPILHRGEVAAIVTSRDIFRYVTRIIANPGKPSADTYQEGIISGGVPDGMARDPGGAEPQPEAVGASAEGA
jgi:CBS domain-containing protein